MTYSEFLATFILQNYHTMGIEKAIADGKTAAAAIYGVSV